MDPAPIPTAEPVPVGELADRVRDLLREWYAHPVVRQQGETVGVLAGKALERAREAVAADLGAAAAERVVAIDATGLPWFAVPADGLRLWRQHGDADGELVTELEAGDPPVQVVVEDAGWLLVRVADGAQGWIAPRGGRPAALAAADAPGARIADATHVDVDRFLAEVERLLDRPYAWGGTTDAGLDCSGLVQRAAWRAGGCWLPRHSRALLRAGRRVAPSDVRRGDVLVLQREPGAYAAEERAQLEALAAQEARTGRVPAHGPAIHPMHVAVATDEATVVHASRDSMRVTRESLAALRSRYRVLGVRRLGPEDPS